MKTTEPTDAKTSAARERILLTAHDLFYRDGIRATGIDRVIAESGVAKGTFYRHFPSKNELIRAFLEFRHRRWMAWFEDALRRHGGDLPALVPAMAEWFRDPNFRGCAFINSVGELGAVMPEVAQISRSHKEDMIASIARLLPPASGRDKTARLAALAVDGAIIRAQFDSAPEDALQSLGELLKLLGN